MKENPDSVCPVCGNPGNPGDSECRYCGQRFTTVARSHRLHETINLEKGMPSADEAVRMLRQKLAEARHSRMKILTVIHGYGASGTGGRIRRMVRSFLISEKGKMIRDFIPGEAFPLASSLKKDLTGRFPDCSESFQKSRANPGLTLIII